MFNNLMGLLWNTSSTTDTIEFKEIEGNDADKHINTKDIENIERKKSSTVSSTNQNKSKKNTIKTTGLLSNIEDDGIIINGKNINISPIAQSITSTPANAISSSSVNSDNRSAYEKAKSILSANSSGEYINLRENEKCLYDIEGIEKLSDEEYSYLRNLALNAVTYHDLRPFSGDGFSPPNNPNNWRGACQRRGKPNASKADQDRKNHRQSLKCNCKAGFKLYRNGLFEFTKEEHHEYCIPIARVTIFLNIIFYILRHFL